MSEMSNEAIQAQIVAVAGNRGLRVGNEIRTATEGAVTASRPIYVDSDSKLAVGAIPFAVLTNAATTTTSVFDITGASTLSDDEIMHNTLVAGAGVTTFTKTGFIQVNITDSAGNITDGKHYIQFGTLT